MTWQRHGRYAYRSVRTQQGVQSQYVGTLSQTHVAATREAEAQERAAAAQRQHAWEEEAARMDADEETIRQLAHAIDTVIHAFFSRAGYHQHHRGAWRKRRA